MTGSSEAHTEGAGPGSELYCIVPPELADFSELLSRRLVETRGEASVQVIVDRRRGDRRTGVDRRRRPSRFPARRERRLAPGLEGRRFAERRAPAIPVDARRWLPAKARPYAERIEVVQRQPLVATEAELARLRDIAACWRKECGAARREARTHLLRRQATSRDALAAALAARDRYTWEHSAAAVWLAVSCAEELGLDAEGIAEVREVAILHDIGKIGIPDAILNKPGLLTEAELEIMRRHPVIGAELIASVETLRHLAPAIRAEHERWDGEGYPSGLEGNQIPVSSRIVFVCDAYHAMTSDRPYRSALSAQAAEAELRANLGTQFWPEATGAMLAMLERSHPRDRSGIALPPSVKHDVSGPHGPYEA